MRARMLWLTVAACGAPADEATDDSVAPQPTACAVEVDDEAYRPDERLLRWPYTSHVTETAVTVQWGLPAGVTGRLHWGADGDLGTLADAELAPIDALVDPLQLHKVRLEGLAPDTTYCYRVEVDGQDVSGPLVLRTAPPPDATRPVRFVVLGDYGSGLPVAASVLQQMRPYLDDVDFWLTTGDNAYSSGTAREWQLNVFWFYRNLLRRVPYFPAPGNHDYGSPLGLQPTLESIDLPRQAYRDEDHGRYYSFDWGPVHVSVLDSQLAVDQVTPDVADDDMIDWLEDDLAAAADRPWRFASWHHPMYNTEPGRRAKTSVREHLVPVVEAGGVEVALQGHSHVYERFSHMRAGEKLASGGTTYVVTGGGGTVPDLIDGEEHEDLIPLRDVGSRENHFMLFEVDRCRVSARAIDHQGRELDAWTLTRPCEDAAAR